MMFATHGALLPPASFSWQEFEASCLSRLPARKSRSRAPGSPRPCRSARNSKRTTYVSLATRNKRKVNHMKNSSQPVNPVPPRAAESQLGKSALLLALTGAAVALVLEPGNVFAQRPLGVDVSSFQGGGINWASVKGSGVSSFAWAKATEGVSTTDAGFHHQRKQRQGLLAFIWAPIILPIPMTTPPVPKPAISGVSRVATSRPMARPSCPCSTWRSSAAWMAPAAIRTGPINLTMTSSAMPPATTSRSSCSSTIFAFQRLQRL